MNVAIRTDDHGTAWWVFSYPGLPGALWFENEVYLPAQSSVQFVISAFDDAPHRITADELFEPFELVQNARGVILGFETSEEQYVLGKVTKSQIPFHILPREEFEKVVTSREGCANGVVIPNPQANPGTVRDCRILLHMRDTLVGDGERLNWDVGTHIFDWEGTAWLEVLRYRFDGEAYGSSRLAVLDLPGHGLTGSIPAEMRSLSLLEYLDLSDNQLTGNIPPELGDLINLRLRRLYLAGNNLSGCIPGPLRFFGVHLGGLPFCDDATSTLTPTPTPTPVPTSTNTPSPTPTLTPTPTPLVEVTRTPSESAYYTQFASIRGVTIKAGDKVDPAAIQEGAKIVAIMIDGRRDIADCIEDDWDSAFAIFPKAYPVTDLPEFSYLKGKKDMWEQSYDDPLQIDGLGPTRSNPVTAVSEWSLIQDPSYPYRRYEVAVHEFAHHLMNLCFTRQDHESMEELRYSSMELGYGEGLMVNTDEFFAGLSEVYFSIEGGYTQAAPRVLPI